MMKWFFILCFLLVAFAPDDTGAGDDSSQPMQCDQGYRYEAVYNTSGLATNGCVPDNQCTKGVIMNDGGCSQCCGAYSNCTDDPERKMAGPVLSCDECYLGITDNCSDCCVNEYGYKCVDFTFLFGFPNLFECEQPKSNVSNFYCGNFCRADESCKIDKVKSSGKDYPYFECIKTTTGCQK